MIKNSKETVGVCGLFCGTCPFYADNICEGCLSEHVAEECASCRHGFRDCAKKHGITWCNECTEFPCERLESFKDVHVVNGISHHEHILEYVARQHEIGIDAWVKEQTEQNSCPVCGNLIVWYEKKCRNCGADICRKN